MASEPLSAADKASLATERGPVNMAVGAALACHIAENRMLNGETIRLDGALRMPPR